MASPAEEGMSLATPEISDEAKKAEIARREGGQLNKSWGREGNGSDASLRRGGRRGADEGGGGRRRVQNG
eukprot:1862422-Rhodomonas_salina.1